MDQSVTCLMVHFILVLKLIFSSSPFLHRSVSSFTHWSAGTFNCPLCGRIWRFRCRQVRQIKPAQLAFGRTIKIAYLRTYLLTYLAVKHSNIMNMNNNVSFRLRLKHVFIHCRSARSADSAPMPYIMLEVIGSESCWGHLVSIVNISRIIPILLNR